LEDRAELRPIETSHAHTIGNQKYLTKIGSEKGKRKKVIKNFSTRKTELN